MTAHPPTPIVRREDGSIDTAFYVRRAVTLRRRAQAKAFPRLAGIVAGLLFVGPNRWQWRSRQDSNL